MSKLGKYLRHHLPEQIAVDRRFLRARFFLYYFNLIPDFFALSPLRNLFLKWGGARIDLFHAYIRSPLWCSDLRGITFGHGVFVNMGCRFEGTGVTIIGDHCQIGPFCCFESVNHTDAGEQTLPVTIGAGVWIGARTVVAPGAEIGDNSVIAAGAVVAKKIPPGELWGGVPARKIKDVKPVQ